MPEITLLSQETIDKIAAGEVVERPSSVVKELVENAIDAKATAVTVEIKEGGISFIRITDNGCGIEAEYIPTAFIRHATSKIEKEEDLESIHTLGFRGEALASVASVSRIELLTKTDADEYAYLYRISGGEEQGIEPAARPVGTTITVRDLFYNTPARMKFLKKDTSEGNYVADVVTQLALSHPEVSFKFVRDGKPQFQTPGDGKLLGAAYAVLSRDFAKDLVPVEHTAGSYTVRGLVTPPKNARASRAMQYFFINGRFVKNRTMMAALENAYKGTMMQGKFPGAVLMLEMPADLVDVNVHPAKTEIRFAKESDVFDAVYRAVRTALATPGSGECRFEMGHTASEAEQTTMQPTAPAAPAAQPAAQHRPAPDKNRFTTLSAAEYRALAGLAAGIPAKEVPGLTVVDSPKPVYKTSAGAAPQPLQGQPPRPVTYQAPSESVLDILPEPEGEPAQPAALQQEVPAQTTPKPEAEASVSEAPDYVVNDPHALSALPDVVNTTPEQTAMTPPPESEPLRLVGEVFKTYIITERAGELCLIDKHAAHERILFEQLAKDYGNVPAQMLLVPVQVNLTAAEKQAVLQNIDLLTDAGIEVEDFGGATVVVRAVPADVPVDDVEDMIIELAARLIDGARDALREKTEWVLHSIACRAAIKAGDKTGAAEMLALAQHIMDGTIPPFCPHGRPCVLKITRKELEKQFGRLV